MCAGKSWCQVEYVFLTWHIFSSQWVFRDVTTLRVKKNLCFYGVQHKGKLSSFPCQGILGA